MSNISCGDAYSAYAENFGNHSSPSTYRSTHHALRILVSDDMVKAIIGRNGRTINEIIRQSNVKIHIPRKERPGLDCELSKQKNDPYKIISLFGSPRECSLGCQLILEIMQQKANSSCASDLDLRIIVHKSSLGNIIGKRGHTIKHLMEITDTKITVYSRNVFDNTENVIQIKGSLKNMCKAEQIISNMVCQLYKNNLGLKIPSTLIHPGLQNIKDCATVNDYPPNLICDGTLLLPSTYTPIVPSIKTVTVHVPSVAIGGIIGTKGCILKDIRRKSGAVIKIANKNNYEESNDPEDHCLTDSLVIITGDKVAQFKAQYIIFLQLSFRTSFGKIKESHLKVEISVPSDKVAIVVGKKGTTLRKLMKESRTVIKVPERKDCSYLALRPIYIYGDFYSSQAAQHQIEYLLNTYQLRKLNAEKKSKKTSSAM